jgi:short-subunit dehydrogenase
MERRMRVFITGASSGIGEGMARHYGRSGATVGMLARRHTLLDSLAGSLRENGATVVTYGADVSDAAAVGQAIDDFVTQAGGADLVIANAGMSIKDSLREGDAASVARLMSVNVVGVTNTIVPFVPIMLRQAAGTLVAVSSMAGHRALPGRAAYSASKAAVITFMDSLRMTLHDTGVHAMSLCPGFVRTPMTASLGHKLPFLLELPDAVQLMADAIERRRSTYTLPWQMNMLKPIFQAAPEWFLRRVAPRGRRESTQ